MPDLSREELWRQLKQGTLAPVYVLYGAETYLRDRAAAEIVNRAFGEGDLREFNYDELSLSARSGIDGAIAAAAQLPMMSARRVVRVADIRVAAASNRDTLREEDEEILGRYLADPSPSTVLILVADELNGNRKVTKLLKKLAPMLEFKPLDDASLTSWTAKTVRDLGSRIDDLAIRMLIDLVGPNLRRLDNEIKKLTTAAMPDGVVTTALVEALVMPSSEVENFVLADAMISGRPERAIAAMKKVLDAGAEPIALLGLISYNIRGLLIAKEMMDRGEDRSRVAGATRMRYEKLENFLAAARRVDRARLVPIFDKLKNADLAMKTSVGGGGPVGTRMQIEVLVCEIATALARH
ncbi:MAG TPA: DNA polymerase III subunit delta [Pyrinomonadaceae bacterium]